MCAPRKQVSVTTKNIESEPKADSDWADYIFESFCIRLSVNTEIN